MRTCMVVSCVLAVVLSAFAYAEDLMFVGEFPTPDGSLRIHGLEGMDGTLFAVRNLHEAGSCMYLLDRFTGSVLREACLNDSLPVCSANELSFYSCAIRPTEQTGDVEFLVGDVCGAIIRYAWSDTSGPDTIRTFVTEGSPIPMGLTFHDGYYYMLNPDYNEILKIDPYSLLTVDAMSLPWWLCCPKALTVRDGNFFVGFAGLDSLYEFDSIGAVQDVHHLANLSQNVAGLAWAGDSLYVSSAYPTIKIYTFGDGYVVWVPEGPDITVEPVPEGIEISFDSVSTPGSLYVDVSTTQPCPPPGQVMFFSDFYDVSTDATFEYITRVTLMTDYELPAGVSPEKVRVFVRPSGECTFWRDITVSPLEMVPPFTDAQFRVLSRTQSEDDEFSVFVLGEDKRNPYMVAELKLGYLEDAITSNAQYIPEDEYNLMIALHAAAEDALGNRRISRALRRVSSIAEIAQSTPAIPHTYDPESSIPNVAGKIISRCHTLAFTLNLLIEEVVFSEEAPMLTKGTPAAPTGEFAPRFVIGSNPSVSGVTIALSGMGKQPVSLSIYSVEGQLVRTLVDGEIISGSRTVTWDGQDSRGSKASTGIYFAVLKQGPDVTSKKVILQR